MQYIKGNFGETRICDCMDPDHGLPSLQDANYDICVTDPPYNIDAGITTGVHYKGKRFKRDNVKVYSDKIDANDYHEWCNCWFAELKRVSKGIAFTGGFANMGFWTYIHSCGYIVWIHKNSSSRAFNAMYNWQEPIFTFGKFNYKYESDVLEFPVNSGFIIKKNHYIHPHPKPYNLWKYLIQHSRPVSVLDPFAGSGLTAEICEEFGIPWLCYEINPAYIPDIEMRVKHGIEAHDKNIKIGEY